MQTINSEVTNKQKESGNKESIYHKIVAIPRINLILVAIPLLYMIVLLYISLLNVLKLSVFDDSGFTLEYIKLVLMDTLYLKVLWITFKTAFIVTTITIFISYPIAYLIAIIKSAKWRRVIMGIVMITLWVSLLVRTFSWMVILQDQGLVNQILMSIGIIQEPIKLIYNSTGVIIGMTHLLLPFMVINLFPVMERIDYRLVEAAKGMGARPVRAFLQIYLPLSIPGIISGSLIVFVMGLGYFITPALLGGQSDMMISKLIHDNVQVSLNWNVAAALSLVLLFATFAILAISFAVSRFSPLFKGDE